MPPKKAAAAAVDGEKKTKSSTTAKSGGKKGKGSPYTIYMKSKLAEFKVKYPDLTHKERFKKVADEWADSPENPKNKSD
ncbi:hypothetical protein FRC03_009460 [Tulasnella sp. 419]|nr:hypothetical protein FRC02_003695 [Tulasnella sp. 418]KAG8958102.1 hypothetical protein FRC03_009460 [Tulasnella sp. 419]